MLKILSSIVEVLQEKKSAGVVKAAEKIAKKAAQLKAKADAITSGKAVKPAAKKLEVSKPAVVKATPVAKSAVVSSKLADAKSKLFVKVTSKSIHGFYANMNSVIDLIEADRVSLKNLPASSAAPSRIATIRNQASIEPALETLNFFPLYKELKAQEHLFQKFPGKLLTNKKDLQRYEIFKEELTALKNEIYAVYQAKHIEVSFNEKISRIDSESVVFADITNLLK
jgi:hypothetical protein